MAEAERKMNALTIDATALQPELKSTSTSTTFRLSKLALTIYTENRIKAQQSEINIFPKLSRKVVTPLYKQPSDTVMYHEIKAKFDQGFKKKLQEQLKAKQRRKNNEKKVVGLGNLSKKRVNSAEKVMTDKVKTPADLRRAFFERVFPEIKKKKEKEEMSGKRGKRKGKKQQPVKYLNAAVIPPCRKEGWIKTLKFTKSDNLIENPKKKHWQNYEQFMSSWATEEQEIFKVAIF